MLDSEEVKESSTSCVKYSVQSVYERFFSIKEICQSPVLQVLFWPILIVFAVRLHHQRGQSFDLSQVASGNYICPSWFQKCEIFYVFRDPSTSYSNDIFLAFFLGLLVIAAFSAIQKKWWMAHLCLMPVFLWEVLRTVFITYRASTDFEYTFFPVVFCFLFVSHKLFFTRRAFIIAYFLAASIKFNDSWIVGSYFSSLQLGLPLVPNWLIPAATNSLVLFEIFCSWLLLSKVRLVQVSVLFLWIGFHVFSATMVGYVYPYHTVPLLICLFFPQIKNHIPSLKSKSALVGWCLIVSLFVLQSVPLLIPGDIRYTQEGLKFGVGMFDAAHQCQSRLSIYVPRQAVKNTSWESRKSGNRCDVYSEWFRLYQKCSQAPNIRIQWSFVHSINGGPFYKIVDTENACSLIYRSLTHNEWIKTPAEGAKIVGYPRKQYFHLRKLPSPSKILASPYGRPELSPLIHKTAINMESSAQGFIRTHLQKVRYVYFTFWLLILALQIFRLYFKSDAEVQDERI